MVMATVSLAVISLSVVLVQVVLVAESSAKATVGTMEKTMVSTSSHARILLHAVFMLFPPF